MVFFQVVFRNTSDIHSLFHNSLSCLVSHPDETLRKRLKEKRKGGLCFCSLLHFMTALISTLVCMNEHEPCELCLSIITHQSANTWPQSTSSSPLTAVQLKEGKKQRRNINLPLYVLTSTSDQPWGMSALSSSWMRNDLQCVLTISATCSFFCLHRPTVIISCMPLCLRHLVS